MAAPAGTVAPSAAVQEAGGDAAAAAVAGAAAPSAVVQEAVVQEARFTSDEELALGHGDDALDEDVDEDVIFLASELEALVMGGKPLAQMAVEQQVAFKEGRRSPFEHLGPLGVEAVTQFGLLQQRQEEWLPGAALPAQESRWQARQRVVIAKLICADNQRKGYQHVEMAQDEPQHRGKGYQHIEIAQDEPQHRARSPARKRKQQKKQIKHKE